jgi:hypothetical protein
MDRSVVNLSIASAWFPVILANGGHVILVFFGVSPAQSSKREVKDYYEAPKNNRIGNYNVDSGISSLLCSKEQICS